MPCEELDIVWNNIKAEARALADCEPMLASFYHATLLKHENLGSALSYMLANKLASSIMPAIAIREVVEEAYAADAEMIVTTGKDAVKLAGLELKMPVYAAHVSVVLDNEPEFLRLVGG